MGPRSADRGILDFVSQHAQNIVASMGPRSADRGIENHHGNFKRVGGLQWGRDQLIAEFAVLMVDSAFTHPLQWGRDQLIAEISCGNHNSYQCFGFNGAAIS